MAASAQRRSSSFATARTCAVSSRSQPDPSLSRGSPLLIGYVGMMAPQDGVDHALRALALLGERRDDWHAIFAGEGDARTELMSLSAELGLEDRVEFVGWQNDEQITRLLSSADVCLAPEPKSPLNDVSTMIKIAEYMAMSRPVVAYELRESRFTAGDAAAYAEPNDVASFAARIDELLSDPARRTEMGRIGRERVERSSHGNTQKSTSRPPTSGSSMASSSGLQWSFDRPNDHSLTSVTDTAAATAESLAPSGALI